MMKTTSTLTLTAIVAFATLGMTSNLNAQPPAAAPATTRPAATTTVGPNVCDIKKDALNSSANLRKANLDATLASEKARIARGGGADVATLQAEADARTASAKGRIDSRLAADIAALDHTCSAGSSAVDHTDGTDGTNGHSPAVRISTGTSTCEREPLACSVIIGWEDARGLKRGTLLKQYASREKGTSLAAWQSVEAPINEKLAALKNAHDALETAFNDHAADTDLHSGGLDEAAVTTIVDNRTASIRGQLSDHESRISRSESKIATFGEVQSQQRTRLDSTVDAHNKLYDVVATRGKNKEKRALRPSK